MYSPPSGHRFSPAFLQGFSTAGSGPAEAAASGGSGSDTEGAGTEGSSAAATAREAVETVVKLAEAQSARTETGARAVTLGFKFGQERLAVRVEMSGGEVHTRFSTDSAELRAAISSEWQSLAAGSSERAFHFSDPVFHSPGGSGEGASRQPFSAARAGRGPADPDGDPAGEPDAATPAILPTSVRLHAFA